MEPLGDFLLARPVGPGMARPGVDGGVGVGVHESLEISTETIVWSDT